MIIDGHCHILPPSFRQRRDELRARDATFASLFSRPQTSFVPAETLLEDMDRDRVARSVVMGMGWADLQVAEEANSYLIDINIKCTEPNRMNWP